MNACFFGGLCVVFLYVFCAIACAFSALCYAAFASWIPVSGSAYAYVSYVESFVGIIGWALIMEYSIENIYTAFSWSGYFTNLLESFHLHVPELLRVLLKLRLTAVPQNQQSLPIQPFRKKKAIGNLYEPPI